MKTLEDQMSFHAAYHQDARNKATHFVCGWALQLWGHVYEGRKPALVDKLFQVFVAPIFLAAEVFFAQGYKPQIHAAVQRRALAMRAEAGIAGRSGALTSA